MIGSNSILNTVVVENTSTEENGFTNIHNIFYDPLAEKIRHVGALDIYHFCTNNLKPEIDRNVFCLYGYYEGLFSGNYLIFNTIKKINLAYIGNIGAYYIIDMNIEKNKQGYILKTKYNTTDEVIVKLSKKKIGSNIRIYMPKNKFIILNGIKVRFDNIVDICRAIRKIGINNIKPGKYKLDEFLKECYEKTSKIKSNSHSYKDKDKYELYINEVICRGLIGLSLWIGPNRFHHDTYYYTIYIISKNNSLYAVIQNSDKKNVFIIYDMNNNILVIHKLYKCQVFLCASLYNGEPHLVLEYYPKGSYYILDNNLKLKEVNKDDLFYFINIGCEDNWEYMIFPYKLLDDAAVEYSKIIIPTHFKKCTKFESDKLGCKNMLINNYAINKLNDKKEDCPTLYKYILSHKLEEGGILPDIVPI